jgi:four helix bundle protein
VDKKKIEFFEDLFVWQQGAELVKEIYVITDGERLRRDFGLRDQMRRAAVSVPSNIAEGFERHSRKEYLHFLHIAKGSVGELRSLLYVAREIGYLSEKEHDHLRDRARFLGASIANQIKSISGITR